MFLEGVEWEDYAEPPPHGEPFKRTQGLIRRPGVERSKRPVYKARVNGVDVSDQGPQLEETMKPGLCMTVWIESPLTISPYYLKLKCRKNTTLIDLRVRVVPLCTP